MSSKKISYYELKIIFRIIAVLKNGIYKNTIGDLISN